MNPVVEGLHARVTDWVNMTIVANEGNAVGIMYDFANLSDKMTNEAIGARDSNPETLRMLGPILNLTIAVLAERMERLDKAGSLC